MKRTVASLVSGLYSRACRPAVPKPRRRSSQLRFESLEHRIVPANVWISGVKHTTEGSTTTAEYTLSRTGNLSDMVDVNLSWGGTAINGTDYNTAPTTSVSFPLSLTTFVTVNAGPAFDDALVEGPETVTLTLSAGTNSTIVSPSSATLTIFDNEIGSGVGSGETAPAGQGFIGASRMVYSAPGRGDYLRLPANGNEGSGINQAWPASSNDEIAEYMALPETLVRPDGSIFCVTCPAFANAGWSNLGAPAGLMSTAIVGNNREVPGMMRLREGTSVVGLINDQNFAQYFDVSGGTYTARHGAAELLTHSSGNKEYTLVDSTGRSIVFHNFDSSIPSPQRGLLKSIVDTNGNTVLSTAYNGSGYITSMSRAVTTGGTTTTSTSSFTYFTSGSNMGRVSNITLTETVGGGGAVTVRSADLDYYGTLDSNGNSGDLKTVIIKDGSSNTLDTQYFRYWTSTGSGGYVGGLKFTITGAAYERYAAWCAANSTTVTGATNSQLVPYADLYLEYDSSFRVTRVDAQGAGCSACSGGVGTYTYTYANSGFANGYNSWKTKRTETLPNSSVRVTYFNYVNEPMLFVHQENSLEWCTFFEYDASATLVLVAAPSAVSGYDETKSDLMNDQSGNYQYVRDSLGLIGTFTYGSSTTATSSTAGDVAGYLDEVAIQRGESGTSILQGRTNYYSRTGGSMTVYPVADATVYRNTNGTGGQTTSYGWTWLSGTVMPEKLTVTLPTVTTAQNGPNSATSVEAVADSYGRPRWMKDQAGFITYIEYDDATNAVTKLIEDVDTTQTGTFSNLPSGWSTPGGGGLHLTTTYVVDNLGRATETTDPNGNVTYTVFRDDIFEVRVYPAWNTSTNAPTGPTIVQREDRARGYRETLTMSATPSLTSSKPNGTETIGSIQSLSRQVLNEAGQVVYSDRYFDLTGVTYSQSSVTLGSSGTNYDRTEFSYDKLGMLNRALTPTGTIYRTYRDGQARTVSSWIGTDDTPTTGFWSPSNLTGTNMVGLAASEYDNGGVGDSNVTRSTRFLGSPYANLDTDFSYDWRNRPVASKSGVEGSESTSLNRPISYSEYDNLGQPIVSEMYDGDTLSINTDSNTDGVPDRPSSSALRAKSTTDFDELGQPYKFIVFSVDPSNGNVSSDGLVSQIWRDSRGLTIKASMPGGTVAKAEYNGIGWNTKSYVTDGGGDSVYGDADDLTSDNVLSQNEITYDNNGNPIFSVARERFHDETGTGALGTPSSGVKARVSFTAAYFDKGDRITDDVKIGTNGGSSYSRAGSVPSRSNTVLVTSYGYNSAGLLSEVTDPKGILGKLYYDLVGRATKSIENYVNGTVSDTDDKTVEFEYNGVGRTKVKAKLTGGGEQVTENVFGIGTSGGLYSNDIIGAVKYPDPSAGTSSSSEQETFTFNRVGEVVTGTDRNGNEHTYWRDILGRMTGDAVTTLGSGVDGTIRRIEVGYNTQMLPYLFTTYDASSSGNVVNQVQRAFNGLGQLTMEYQAVNGAVNTGSTPKVQYAYTEMSGGANHSRLTDLIYPNGRNLEYNYSNGLNDSLTRISSISDSSTTLESYEYLGFNGVVKLAHPETGVDLTYIKLTGESDGTAGDKYNGLDLFGRIVDQRWTTSGGTAMDRFQYGYDRNSNPLYKENLVDSTRSELFSYDDLNQLSSFQRGTLNGGKTAISGVASRSQSWDFDAIGNFDSQTTNGTAETRTHNKQNELTAASSQTSPTYDNNGNQTQDFAGKGFKFNAWNQLVQVNPSGGGSALRDYEVDAIGRRIQETISWTTRDFYYSDEWQVLEERVSGTTRVSYAWSPVFVDAMIARDRDSDSNGSLEERLYAMHDANFNVTGLVNTSGTVVERFANDPYGMPTYFDASYGSRGSSSYGWNYLHQGLRWDGTTGKYWNRARDFDPVQGRFIGIDPLRFGAGDLVLFRSYWNSPINNSDSSGLGDDDSGWDYLFGIRPFRRYLRECSKDSELEAKRRALPANLKPMCDDEGNVIGPTKLGSPGTHEELNFSAAGLIASELIVRMLKRGAEEPLKNWLLGKGIKLIQSGGKYVMKRGTSEVTDAEARFLLMEYTAESKMATHFHHAWPKYLGGPAKQQFEKLPKWVHDSYHSGLDKILPRHVGGKHYAGRSAAEKAADMQALKNYTQDFDKKYGTNLWEAFLREVAACK